VGEPKDVQGLRLLLMGGTEEDQAEEGDEDHQDRGEDIA
jgi:hypothetical protein